jgi:hypothetical protein
LLYSSYSIAITSEKSSQTVVDAIKPVSVAIRSQKYHGNWEDEPQDIMKVFERIPVAKELE